MEISRLRPRRGRELAAFHWRGVVLSPAIRRTDKLPTKPDEEPPIPVPRRGPTVASSRIAAVLLLIVAGFSLVTPRAEAAITSVSPSGGTAQSGTAKTLTATVTSDTGGCTASASGPMSATIPSSCGTLTVNVFSSAAPGTYSVSIFDAGGGSASFTVNVTEAPATTTTLPPPTTTQPPTTTTTRATTTTTTLPPKSLLDVAIEAGEFSTFIAAIEAAGLNEALEDEGPFTVFAPTDAAFQAAFEEYEITAEELLADTDTLTQILTYHLLPEVADAADLAAVDGEAVPTVNGEPVAVSVQSDELMVNNATVLAADLEADNGIVHTIDTVLLPPDVVVALTPTTTTITTTTTTTTTVPETTTSVTLVPPTPTTLAAAPPGNLGDGGSSGSGFPFLPVGIGVLGFALLGLLAALVVSRRRAPVGAHSKARPPMGRKIATAGPIIGIRRWWTNREVNRRAKPGLTGGVAAWWRTKGPVRYREWREAREAEKRVRRKIESRKRDRNF